MPQQLDEPVSPPIMRMIPAALCCAATRRESCVVWGAKLYGRPSSMDGRTNAACDLACCAPDACVMMSIHVSYREPSVTHIFIYIHYNVKDICCSTYYCKYRWRVSRGKKNACDMTMEAEQNSHASSTTTLCGGRLRPWSCIYATILLLLLWMSQDFGLVLLLLLVWVLLGKMFLAVVWVSKRPQ